MTKEGGRQGESCNNKTQSQHYFRCVYFLIKSRKLPQRKKMTINHPEPSSAKGRARERERERVGSEREIHPEIPDRPRALCCPIHLTPGYTTKSRKKIRISKKEA